MPEILKHCSVASGAGCDVNSRAGHDYILETAQVNKTPRGNADTTEALLVKRTNTHSKYRIIKKPKSIDQMNKHFNKINKMLLKKEQENFYVGGGDGMGLGLVIRGVSTRKCDLIVVLVLLVLLFVWMR